jgi:hypothetical protein
VVIEVDGATHSTADEVVTDRQREDWLRNQGFRIRRYQNIEIVQNIEGVLSDIESVLAHPPLQLSPARGGQTEILRGARELCVPGPNRPARGEGAICDRLAHKGRESKNSVHLQVTIR